MVTPESAYQNSAGRLLAILNTLPNGQPYLDVIPKMFGTTGTTQEEVLQACLTGLMEIHKLYLAFRQDMFDADISEQQRKVILSGLVNLQQSIYPTSMGAGFRRPTDAEKSLLEVAATIIPQEAKLQKDDIEKIRESITSLRLLVEDAEISPTIRKVLLELIRISEDAISRFNIHGARGLRKAFKEMLGEAAEIYGLTGEGEREALKKSGAWASIVKNLKVFDEVGARLLKYKPMLENASRLLLGGPGPGN